MRSRKKFLYLLLSLFFLILACSDGKEKGDFSGVSNLIADRNQARYDVAENPAGKKRVKKKIVGTPTGTIPNPKKRKEEISSIVLYEQKIEIVGTESGRSMAKGIAYVNKKGQIVRIKILRE